MPLPEGLDMLIRKGYSDSEDYLCKWCLTYVGQRRQFCSADCAAQFKLCQRRRDQKQNLNISVDYYGNVKLSIQGLPISAGEEFPDGHPYVGIQNGAGGGGRRVRRRRRCKNCAKLLLSDNDDEYCDETCHEMLTERSKKEEYVNTSHQKDAAERRRIRKWLNDAQDQYTKQLGDGLPDNGGIDVSSGPAALNPLPVFRTPLPISESLLKRPKESARSLGAPFSFRRIQHVPEETYKLKRDEVVTGGPVTLNPTPLRKGLPRRPRDKNIDMDPDKRQLMIDLNWIPKFNI